MTVYIEKPAVNLRSELASLRNQGGYQEQQFYFDGLVANGTFDSDTSGWTATASSLSVVSQKLRITNTGTNGYASQLLATTVGKSYTVSFDALGGDATFIWLRVNDNVNQASGTSVLYNTSIGVSSGTNTFTFTASSAASYIHFVANGVSGKYIDIDNVFIFETDGADVVHRMPKGWVPLHVYEDGLLQREGAANDYEVVYDGFDYYVKPAVAPSATTQTCVIGVRK